MQHRRDKETFLVNTEMLMKRRTRYQPIDVEKVEEIINKKTKTTYAYKELSYSSVDVAIKQVTSQLEDQITKVLTDD